MNEKNINHTHFVPLRQTRQPVKILRDLITREHSRDCWGLLERAEFKSVRVLMWVLQLIGDWLDIVVVDSSVPAYCSYLLLKWYKVKKYGITPLWGDMWMILEYTMHTYIYEKNYLIEIFVWYRK